MRPPKDACCLGGAEGLLDLPPSGQGPPEPHCAQARIVRATREHKARVTRSMMSNRTRMQDKYCSDCYDFQPIQSQYKGGALRPRHLFCGFLCYGFAQVEYRGSHHNTCVWTSSSSPFGHHVPSPFGQCTLARSCNSHVSLCSNVLISKLLSRSLL